MPEGPSIRILKEKLEHLHIKGHTILETAGNAQINYDKINHKKIVTFKTWGKHFLICLEDSTIRIHLMMFGTYLINDRKTTPLKLRLSFDDTELNFYTCVVKLIEGDLDKFYDWSADIMSDTWSTPKAVKKLREYPDRLICDLLLEQDIFAGVGNIIKNEALYKARIHPASVISKIPPAKLNLIIKEARDYSFDFFKWRKEETLSKHWEVYTKKRCPLEHDIKKINLGKNKRRSFICETCQKLYN
ncbi:DNA-formamidopyrimidine glycosylase family protein [Pedobacter sp. JCM 36344]|uniref:DNA-formamidopyrimidine glycosylase family protein n=1 Tax=Pedobacter sp. JCM 36344 TaxID=3374280 RepID=UPI00397D8887